MGPAASVSTDRALQDKSLRPSSITPRVELNIMSCRQNRARIPVCPHKHDLLFAAALVQLDDVTAVQGVKDSA